MRSAVGENRRRLHRPIDIIGNWNDEDGRTVADVLILLYATADDWDAAHPLPRNDSTSSVAGGQS